MPDLGAQQDVGEHRHRALAIGDALREACPGRFDCTIKIDFPTASERSQILALLIDMGETSSVQTLLDQRAKFAGAQREEPAGFIRGADRSVH